MKSYLRCHPAWRIDAPSHCVLHTRTFDHGGSSPSRILGKTFLLALRSPFPVPIPAAFPPPAALCEGFPEKYSLFLNGLPHDSINFFSMQRVNSSKIVLVLFLPYSLSGYTVGCIIAASFTGGRVRPSGPGGMEMALFQTLEEARAFFDGDRYAMENNITDNKFASKRHKPINSRQIRYRKT